MLKPIKSVSKLLLVASLMGVMACPDLAQAAPAATVAAPQGANTATGVIKDEFGDPMIGATIRVAGNPSQGAATNIDGEFSIANVKPGTKLQITSVGYKLMEVVWNGTALDIDMELNTQQLDEVVVTAMGITREAKTLTYAAQTIKNDEVTRIKETNFVNALQGKSAGLTITPNNSGAGGGASKIVLRGSTSILGSNQPLIVLDGVPMQANQGTQQGVDGIINGGGGSSDDILSTINPEDIENMTILKGPNAAALYGSAANNGVIVITTKSGSAGEVKVDISSSTSIDQIAMYPKTQRVFGATSSLLTGESSVLGAWGPKIGTRDADAIASKPYMLNSSRDGIKDFFETGLTLNNGITMSGGNEFSRTYFSYNNTYQKGVMQNNKFMRHNVMLKETFSLFNKKVNISASLNWIHQKTNNQPNTGKTLSALHALYRMPADVDVRYFKNHYKHAGTMNDIIVSDPETGNIKLIGQPVQTWDWYDKSLNNPYWVTNMYNKENKRDRILANLTADWTIWKNLKYQTRLSIDMLMDESQYETWAGMYEAGWLTTGGQYSSGNSRSSDIYNDHMLTWNDRFKDKFDVNVAVGGSFSRHYDRSKSVGVNIDTVGVPNAFTVDNGYRWVQAPDGSLIKIHQAAASDSWGYKDWNSALFATVSVGLWDKVYLDGSYRLEWAQSFQQFTQGGGYKSFDYYSAGANVLVDKFLPRIEWLDQLKWRGSWSVVGNPIPNTLFARQSLNFGTGAISSRPPTFDNPQPETTTSFETGIDMWMFNNKFNVDLTYYNSTLKNQFMYITTASGESKPVNTGKIRNYGFEFSAGYRWAINRDWTWQSNVNFAWNDNKILETYDPGDGRDYTVEMGNNAFKIKYIEGGKYGDLYVNSFSRDDNGNIRLSGEGLDARPAMEGGTYSTYVGNTTSPYRLGWNNTVTWKNLTLYFLIDGRIGGKVMSYTEAERDLFGLSQRTANARLAAMKDPALQAFDKAGNMVPLMYLPDGSGRTIPVENYYTTIGAAPMEDHVYNATSFRMRDISLSYVFPNLLGRGKALTTQFSVKNAFFLYKDSPVDPDISMSAANGLQGIDVYALPTLRSYAITLKVNF